MIRRWVAAALVLVPLNGCAAFSGFFGVGRDEVALTVQGTHDPVEVEVQGLYNGVKTTFHGKDKIKLKLPKDQDCKVTVRATGFEPVETVVQRKLNTFALLDGLCCAGGVVTGLTQGTKLVPTTVAGALGPATGACCGLSLGCCASGMVFGMDSVLGNTQVYDPTLTIKLAPAKQTSRGWVLPLELDGVMVELPLKRGS